MRLVAAPEDLASAIRAARSEAGSSFGDPHIYIERQLRPPRHIEIQLLADTHGNVVPFVERECSIQRRHQKVLEESPSVAVRRRLAPRWRGRGVLGRTRRRLHECRDGRVPAGSRRPVLLPGDEHAPPGGAPDHRAGVRRGPGPLAVCRSRSGERLTLVAAEHLTPRGHAIECRIYAEDPDNGFMPSPGRMLGRRVPGGPGIRRDDGGATPRPRRARSSTTR